MIEYKTGDLLNEDTEAIVNTVNCVGVMGRGIALQFKQAFPENFKAYAAACKRQEVKPGRMFVFNLNRLTNPRYIINFPTKRHWRGKSRLEDIETGLQDLLRVMKEKDIHSIALPPLGAGLGELNWKEAKTRIESALDSLKNIRVIVFEPKSRPGKERGLCNRKVPKMTPGRAALVELMDRYLKGLLDPFITLLELHKLMYFMQEAGEPLRLKYTKGFYGPYAENLRHVLIDIEGHMIFGYADGGDAPEKPLQIVPGAVKEASEVLDAYPETRGRFLRVIDLVEGFESPFGLELLATVHWVMKYESLETEDVIKHTYAWNEHKRRFTSRQIKLAVDVLTCKGWVGPLAKKCR